MWNRKTSDLLFRLPLPTTAGAIRAPFINIGDMNNKGFDFGATYRGNAKALKYDIGLVVGAYKNEILRVGNNDEAFFTGGGSRFSVGGITRGIKGQPIVCMTNCRNLCSQPNKFFNFSPSATSLVTP